MIKKTILAICVFSLLAACNRENAQAAAPQASTPQTNSPHSKVSEAETEGVDWTPLFKSWEKECASSKQLDACCLTA